MKPESMKLRDLVPNNSTSQKIQDTFSFVTYNVLADCHVQTDYASIYDPQHINAEFRHKQIIKELEYLDGDIVCLQEVSPDFYERQLRDYFTRYSDNFSGMIHMAFYVLFCLALSEIHRTKRLKR